MLENKWLIFQAEDNLTLKNCYLFNDSDKRDKKISLFWKKNIEMHHCHHCCNYGTFFTPLSSSWVIFSRSRRRARDIKYELLHNALRHNSDQKVQFQM